ncbi:MAG TPA: hypothetical protein VKV41_01025 [Methylomirabilota bacterium]|nr:hypothetical protein [Methylomirabilota bacterium]
MSDLLGSARELRQKLYRLEVLLDVEKGGRGRAANSVRDPERAAALDRLLASGLIEADGAPGQYRLTSDGFEFLKDVRSKVGAAGALDWTRADEIDFSRL